LALAGITLALAGITLALAGMEDENNFV